MSLNLKELKVIGNKVSYQCVIVATINDMDMSKQRFEFEDFLKNAFNCRSHESELEAAFNQGFNEGKKEGLEEGMEDGYDEGFKAGMEDGYDEGFKAGKEARDE